LTAFLAIFLGRLVILAFVWEKRLIRDPWILSRRLSGMLMLLITKGWHRIVLQHIDFIFSFNMEMSENGSASRKNEIRN
jgi:hypothetical protein